MAESTQYLVAVVGADVTQFRKGMRDVRSELGLLDADSASTLGRLGRTLTYTLTTPLAIAGASAVNSAADFEAAMRNVNSIAFLTEQSFADLTGQVFEFGKTTREGVTGSAEALYTIYSAGLEGAAAMYTMNAAVRASEAGLSEVSTTAEGLTAVMLAYGIGTEQGAGRAADALTRMVQVGVGSMQSFVGSIATFIPAASSLGVDFEEAFGLNAMLTQLAYSPSEAATRVNAAMRSMLKPTEAMEAAFNKLGVKTTKELIAKFGGLHEALIALRGTTDGTEEAIYAMFGETRAVQGVMALTNNVETSRRTLEGFMAGLDGATDRARAEQMKTFAYSWDRLTASIDAASIKIGSVLTPLLKPLLDSVSALMIEFTDLEDSTIGLGVAGAGLVAALGPILWITSSLISPLGLMIAGFVTMNAAITDITGIGLAAWFTNQFSGVNSAFNSYFKPVIDAVTEFMDYMSSEPATIPDIAPSVGMKPTEYVVQSGDTLWDIWQETFLEDFPTFEGFKAAVGLEKPWELSVGDVLSIGQTGTRTEFNFLSPAEIREIENAPNTFYEKFTAGWGVFTQRIAASLPQILTGIDGFFGWVLEGVRRGVEDLGRFVFAGEDGDSPLYRWVKTNIIDPITSGSLLQQVGGLFSGTASSFGALIGELFSTLTTEVIPTVARTGGYLAGKIGQTLLGAIASVMEWLTTGGPSDAANDVSTYVDSNIITPFTEGFEEAGGAGAFTGILASLQTSIGNLFNGIASLFSGTQDTNGNTAVYNAIHGAFKYLFGGGLGTDIEGMSGPIGTAFGNLLNNIGTWIQTDGVPTISRSIGFFVGTIGGLLGRGLEMLWATLSGSDGGGGQDAFAELVGTPFQEGMNDALALQGVDLKNTSWVDKLLTGIAGAIGLGALMKWGIFGTAAAAIGAAFNLALAGVNWAASSIGTTLLNGLMVPIKLTLQAASLVGSTFLSGITSLIGLIFTSPIAFAIAAVVSLGVLSLDENWRNDLQLRLNDLTGQGEGYYDLEVKARPGLILDEVELSTGIRVEDSAIDAADRWLAMYFETLQNGGEIPSKYKGPIITGYEGLGSSRKPIYDSSAFKPFLGPDNPSAQEAIQAVRASIEGVVEAGFNAYLENPMDVSGLSNPVQMLLDELFKKNGNQTVGEAKPTIYLSEEQLVIATREFSGYWDDVAEYMRVNNIPGEPPDALTDLFNISVVPTFTVDPTTYTGAQPSQVAIGTSQLDKIRAMFAGVSLDIPISPNLSIEAGTGLTDAITTSPELAAAAETFGTTFTATALSNADTYMTNNTIDPAKVEAALVTPMYDTLKTAYGLEGSVTMLWIGFAETFGETGDEIEATIKNLSINIPPYMKALQTTVTGAADAMKDSLSKLMLVIASVITGLKELTGLEIPSETPYTPSETVKTGDKTPPTKQGFNVLPMESKQAPQQAGNVVITGNTFQTEADVDTLIRKLERMGYNPRRNW